MTPEDFAPLAISRYELNLRAHEACSLPAFLGSTLRGAFGHALRDTVRVIDGRDCDGCSSADPCAYHYLFETPVPPHVTQLRGQREAPVPFILSPPLVQNPVRRVWRVPSVQAAAARSLSNDSRSRIDPHSAIVNSQSTIRNSQSSILDPRSSSSLSGSAELGGFARNASSPQFEITSVVFPDSPRRFRAGDVLSFDLVLIGRAVELINYVVKAIELMAQRGLGANRAAFELMEVSAVPGALASRLPGQAEGSDHRGEARPLSQLISERLAELTHAQSTEHSPKPSSIEAAIVEALGESIALGRRPAPARSDTCPLTPDPYSLRLRFLTPARIRVNGDLQTELSFDLLVRNLLRRVSMLAAVHGGGALDLDYRGLIKRAESVATVKSSLHWWDLERYTNRQNGKLRVGGMIGEVEYEGEAIKEFLPLLVAGELLHVGTGTSFGLGKFVVPPSGGSQDVLIVPPSGCS